MLRGKYCSETDWGWQQLDVEIPLTSAAPADTPALTDTYDGVQVQLKGTQGTITLSPAPKPPLGTRNSTSGWNRRTPIPSLALTMNMWTCASGSRPTRSFTRLSIC